MSFWHLFLAADWIGKCVMVMLLIASGACWAIIFDKWLKIRALRRSASDFEEAFWSGGSLEDLYDRMGNHPQAPMSSVFSSAMRDLRRSSARWLTARGTSFRSILRHPILLVIVLLSSLLYSLPFF